MSNLPARTFVRVMSQWLPAILLCSLSTIAFSQYTISGYVTDAGSGETLPGANITVLGSEGIGTSSNTYGFYSLSLPEGSHRMMYSYLGYQRDTIVVLLSRDTTIDVELSQGVEMEEVVVTENRADDQVESTEMSTVELPTREIQKLPALFGEVDVLKMMQLLPGVLSSGEGTTGFHVRGGSTDQNLVLLDEAVIYNPGHLLGFFSVFNPDAIKKTTLIKGGMPARYGGRISSLVDVQLKDGNDKHYNVEGGVGLVSSRLTVEGPVIRERSSFMVSARRTYVFDLAQPFIDQTDFAGTNYFFYDLNLKFNHRFSEKDRVYLSGYFGRDVLKFGSEDRDFSFDIPYGNSTLTFRWNHLFSDKMFMNLTGVYNDYSFEFEGGQELFMVDLYSGVKNANVRIDFDYYPSSDHQFRFGAHYTWHKLTPNIVEASDGETMLESPYKARYGNEGAVYVSDEFTVGTKWRFRLGLRASGFVQTGPYTSEDGTAYDRGETVETYWGLAPRFRIKYSLNNRSSLKASYTHNYQYIHLVSNSTTTLPTDIWVPSTQKVKPQFGLQYALGYFHNFDSDRWNASIETYYRSLDHQIDYRETYVNNIIDNVEDEFVFGDGEAYGLELFLRKNKGDWTGWIGYTLSRSERQFDKIDNGETFPAAYDRTHDLSVVAQYQVGDRWNVGGNFVYGTGKTYTPIIGLYYVQQSLHEIYGDRNSARLRPYHRLDLSATFTPKPEKKEGFRSSWSFSVYNVYNRKNPFFIYTDFETNTDKNVIESSAYRVSLFPIIPSITWNFKWQGK